MSTVPAEIAGIGSTAQRLRVSPGFDPLKAAVGPEEYFVLSRIDGTQTLREVLLATGLPVDRAVSIVSRLRSIGALLLPGETTAPPPTAPPLQRPSQPRLSAGPAMARTASGPIVPRTASGTRPAPARPAAPVHDLSLPGATPEELAALAEDADLEDRERRRILAMARLAHGRDPHALLGVSPSADARMLKLAYFQLSKEIHPDRYYGKRLGSFAARMSTVFEAASRAYARLTTSDRGRAAAQAQASSDLPQTPQEYAAELFERACQLEVGGDALEAMKLFAAAVRVDPQARYLRRAASCALAADQPRTAVEYAKKAHTLAPNDASAARLLAHAFRAAGKLEDAEEVLVIAMAIKSENDVLTAELENDLAEVRRLLSK
ncbi:MAG TPA: hypothetical protein VK932_06960 [Kofleriaceae bacterium]|nr:hypothetical protein [Kofleriaceae bacterium]